jgi:hypothetical protein
VDACLRFADDHRVSARKHARWSSCWNYHAAPGCWSLFNEVTVQQYEIASFDLRRLAIDADAVQHPGTADRRAV